MKNQSATESFLCSCWFMFTKAAFILNPLLPFSKSSRKTSKKKKRFYSIIDLGDLVSIFQWAENSRLHLMSKYTVIKNHVDVYVVNIRHKMLSGPNSFSTIKFITSLVGSINPFLICEWWKMSEERDLWSVLHMKLERLFIILWGPLPFLWFWYGNSMTC